MKHTRSYYPALGLCMLSLTAHADDGDTFKPYASVSYAHDSNLFRVANDVIIPGNGSTAEQYHTLTAGMNVDLPLSRQVIRARAELSQTRFDTYKQLNYDGRDLLLQWSWLVGNNTHGDVGVSETRSQGSLYGLNPQANNVRTRRRRFFNGTLKLDNRWQINTAAARMSNTVPSLSILDFTEDSLGLGLQYQTRMGTLFELSNQISKGAYPNRQVVGTTPVDNSYEQMTPSLGVTLQPTGKTRIQAKLGYTQRTYSDVPRRNFSGFTGRLSTDWFPTGKTALNLAIYRDIGAYDDSNTSYTLNNGVAIGATWFGSAKTTLNLRASLDKLEYDGDPGFVPSTTPVRQDSVTNLQASIKYLATRNVIVSTTLQTGERTSNRGASLGYRYNSAQISVRGEF